MNFWDFSSWGFFNLMTILLGSLLIAQMLKRSIPALEASLIPTSVLGGGVLLVISTAFKFVTGEEFFDTAFFGGNGSAWLELITYHTLALGFTASALKSSSSGFSKERSIEIFNTGLTTVATYLLQAFVGMIICIIGAIASLVAPITLPIAPRVTPKPAMSPSMLLPPPPLAPIWPSAPA